MYRQITSNKRKTWILVTLFSVFVVLLFLILGASLEIDPVSSLIFGTAFAIVYSLISFYAGDKVTLMTQGAKPIEKRDARELYNIVENLSITAGIMTPKIYIIDDPSPNAFATGRDPYHASVAVTSGLLQTLNKQELEGVMAHEISHIRNYDIRLMTIVVILIGLIALISQILIRVLYFRPSGSRKGGSPIILILLLAGVILGILSPLIAEVIKLAVSRTREYLADASGALLTRYPEGLANALEKISKDGTKMKRASHATAHLFISDPYGDKKHSTSWFHRLFMTHPPANDRIAKLRAMASG